MIIIHYSPSCLPAVATIHLVPEHEFPRMIDRAMLILRSMCGNGVPYSIRMVGK